MTTNHSILYGNTIIQFQVYFVKRKTLEIAVHPSREVIIIAPLETKLDDIKVKVKKRARWILRQRLYFEQFLPRSSARQFFSGESHLYLGRQYRLKPIISELTSVKLSRGFFIVEDKSNSPEQISILMTNWYRQKALYLFQKLIDELWMKFSEPIELKPKLQIKIMQTRWGSLSKGGILSLNPNLIRAPKECIEYVICHELCHIQFHDHSRGFFKLLQSRMPDWPERKLKLEKALV